MTGPAEGKIPIRGIVELIDDSTHRLECNIYLHVKGYSLARVTHIDLEHPILNEIIKPKKALYLPFKIRNSRIIVFFKEPIHISNPGIIVRKISIYCPELASALGEGESSFVYVGGKVGGIFLGFKKVFVRRLESLAKRLGVEPR